MTRAVRIHALGGPEVLQLEEWEVGEPGPGEVIVRGEASPASHGPFRFDGRYTVRFEQIAPEDPGMDFAAQTPFVASADRRAEVEDGGSVRLFRDAARAGETEVTLHGRLYIDVSFGDFPYAIRLTPAG